MGHSWKTVQTKEPNALLGIEYSEKLIAISNVWARGITFFGKAEQFNHWLRQFNPLLDHKPIDLLKPQ